MPRATRWTAQVLPPQGRMNILTGQVLCHLKLATGSIGFPEIFRAPLGRLSDECFTVASHQNSDLTGRLSEI